MSSDKEFSVSNVLNSNVQRMSKTAVMNLAIAIKVSKLYSSDHVNVTDAMKGLSEVVREFIETEGYLQITRFEDFLLVNELRVRLELGGLDNFKFIVDLFTERGLGEIIFAEGVTDAELENLVTLFHQHVPDEEKPWEKFRDAAGMRQFQHVTLTEERDRRQAGEEIISDARSAAIRTFFKCCYGMRSALKSARGGNKSNLKRLKRHLQSMVDMVQENQNILLSLVNVKNFASPEANHAVNVAVLSIALGAKLGLSKRLLGDLGMSALLHDFGKTRIPPNPPSKDRFNSAQARVYEKHVYFGPEQLLKQRVVNATVKSINVAFLHHYRFDGTGYPKLVKTKAQNLFTRIVAVANYYDSWTTPGREQGEAKPADQILSDLMAGSGTAFDPLVVKAFVNVMGLFPVGCMVQLATGEIGTVVEASANPRFLDRPKVRLVSDSFGNGCDEIIDLMDRAPDGSFPCSILKLYQQEEIALEIDEYLSVI